MPRREYESVSLGSGKEGIPTGIQEIYNWDGERVQTTGTNHDKYRGKHRSHMHGAGAMAFFRILRIYKRYNNDIIALNEHRESDS